MGAFLAREVKGGRGVRAWVRVCVHVCCAFLCAFLQYMSRCSHRGSVGSVMPHLWLVVMPKANWDLLSPLPCLPHHPFHTPCLPLHRRKANLQARSHAKVDKKKAKRDKHALRAGFEGRKTGML